MLHHAIHLVNTQMNSMMQQKPIQGSSVKSMLHVSYFLAHVLYEQEM